MKVYGPLEEAGYEVVTSLPTEAFQGRQVILNDGNIYTYFDGEWKLTGSLTQAVKTQPSVDPLEDAGDILGLDTDGKINSGFIRDKDKVTDQTGATPGQVLTTDGDPNTPATWEDAAGTGGGLEVEYRNSDFTAEFGKHYLVDTTGSIVNVQLPSIASVPVEDQGNAKIRFSDEGRSWHVNPANLIPDPADKIYDADIGETYEMNVMMTWVQIQRAADLIWNMDHVFQPLEAGSGGGGGASAGINYLIDGGDAEEGVLDVEVVGDGTIEGETVAPLIGTSSYKATVNSSVTTQPKFRLAVNDIDLAFLDSTKLKGTGLFVTDAEGWKVRLIDASDDSVVTGTEVTLPNGRFNVSFGNVPETGKSYKYELYAETAPADSVCTYDSLFYGFKETGAADLNGWKIYDETIVTVGLEAGTPSFLYGQFIPYKDSISGLWRLRFNFTTDISGAPTTTAFTFSIAGIVFATTEGAGHWACTWGSNFSDANNIVANAINGTNFIDVVSAVGKNMATRHYLSGDVPLAGKPTWADYEPTGVALTNETLNANARVQAECTGGRDTTLTQGAWVVATCFDDIRIAEGFIVDGVKGNGTYQALSDMEKVTVSGVLRTSTGITLSEFSYRVRLFDKDDVGKENIEVLNVGTERVIQFQGSLADVKKDDYILVEVYHNSGGGPWSIGGIVTYIELERASNFTSETTVVADLATKDSAGFVRYGLVGRKSLDSPPNGTYSANHNGTFMDRYTPVNAGVYFVWVNLGDVQAGIQYRLETDILCLTVDNQTSNRGILRVVVDTVEVWNLVDAFTQNLGSNLIPIPIPDFTFTPTRTGQCELQYWAQVNGSHHYTIRQRGEAALYAIDTK